MNNPVQEIQGDLQQLRKKAIIQKAEAMRILSDQRSPLDINNGNQVDLEEYIDANYRLRRNLVTGNVEICELARNPVVFQELDTIFLNSIILRAKRSGQRFKKGEFKDLISSDFVGNYDPMVLYAEQLPEHTENSPDYIEMLANTVIVPEGKNENWVAWLRKWLVATIACATNPRIINQTVLVFTGAQGIGKTRWFNSLVPEALSRFYYTGAINPSSKDSIIHTAECFIINLDELGSFVERRTEDFKELITKERIRIRKPYSPDIINLPRRASFVGSTNKFQFLHDPTGSRRILSFEATAITIPNFNIDLVWAQAYHLFKNGFQYWFDEEEIEQVNRHNMPHVIVCLEEEMLRRLFEPCEEHEEGCLSLSTAQILQFIIARDNLGARCNVIRLGRTLQSNGFRPRRSNGNQYYNVRLIKDEVDSSRVKKSKEAFNI